MAPARFQFNPSGTRFLIYPQPKDTPGFADPVEVRLKAEPGTLEPGPADRRMHVIQPKKLKEHPYKHEGTWKSRQLPPFTGATAEPRAPDPDGHFVRPRPGTQAFTAATVFATVSCTLEIWEHHFGREISFYFSDRYQSLEIIPRVDSPNSWSGEGFFEFGFLDGDPKKPDAENFDGVAHETGHLILKSVMGNHTEDKKILVWRAHEESAADFVSLIAAMHFDEVICYVLREKKGRLHTANILSRIGEHRDAKNRVMFNALTVNGMGKAWVDYDTHAFSLPFSGAVWDLLVAIYHDNLCLADLPLGPRGLPARRPHEALARTDKKLPKLFVGKERVFTAALLDARDELAALLARTWETISVDGFDYIQAAQRMLAADEVLTKGSRGAMIRTLFRARDIPTE